MQTEQIMPEFIGIVQGFQASEATPHVASRIRAEIDRSGLLVFKDQQELDDDARLSFSRLFGEPHRASQDYVNIPETVKIWGVETKSTAGRRQLFLSERERPGDGPDCRGPLPFQRPNAPKHTFSVSADQRRHQTAGPRGLHFIDDYTPSPLVQAKTSTSRISLQSTNAQVGLDDIPLGGESKLYVGVFGRNIFNVANDAFTFATGTSDPTAAGNFANAVDPRTYGVEARVRF